MGPNMPERPKSCDGNCCYCKDDPDGKYPRDCFSFIAQGNVWSLPFWYGWMVAFFEISFILLIICSKVYRPMSANEDVDNPNKFADDANYANWLPANSSGIVRTTQVFAVFAIALFSDESLNDFSNAVRFFPGIESRNGVKEKNIFWARVASTVKGVQGFFACSCVILLVMTSGDVIDIILNFAAVNFVSTLDDIAFELAKDGKYGEILREAAEDIEGLKLTECRKGPWRKKLEWILPQKQTIDSDIDSDSDDDEEEQFEEDEENWTCQSHVCAAFTVFVVMFAIYLIIVRTQMKDTSWTTHMFRIQFDEESGLEHQSGCYKYTGEYNDKREVYQGYKKHETEKTMLAYCKRDRRWIFFESNGTQADPCTIDIRTEMAHSEKTNSFDISSSFESSWLSPYNKPLDVYFIDNPNNAKDGDFFFCESFANDGKCNPDLNIFDYQYDGGDCCPTTCTHPDCLATELETVFGQPPGQVYGAKGFPLCEDATLVTLTITLIEMNKEVPEWVNENYIDFEDFWDSSSLVLTCDPDETLVLSTPINQMMIGQTMTAKVGQESVCTLVVNHFRPRVEIYVSVDGDDDLDTKITIKLEPSYSIPSQIGLLEHLTELDLGNEALTGTIPTEIALLSSMEKIVLDRNSLTGTIPTDITLLYNLTTIVLGSNKISGFIPSGIGELSNMVNLDLSNNSLTGSVPDEIDLLKNLRYLDLSSNPLLCGSVNCTKFTNMEKDEQDRCRTLNTFRSCVTAAPSESISPSALPSQSLMPSVSLLPSVSLSPTKITESPSLLPSEFNSTAMPSSAPSASPSSLPPSASPSSLPSLGCSSIVDIVCNRGGFDQLCTLLLTKRDPILPTNYTLFAPPDTSFDEIADSLALLSAEELASVFFFHITQGRIGVDDLVCKETLEMVSGISSRTRCINEIPWIQFGGGNRDNNRYPMIFEADVEACDGLIHFVTEVLLPKPISVVLDPNDGNFSVVLDPDDDGN